ncbi:MAG: hypothetical protein JOZ19_10575 [Rubrobacter sp.]|nr:hypothetical protein [Rubrobacter sp.]
MITVGVDIYQLYAAYEAKFQGELKLVEMSDTAEKLVTLAGRIGTAARASPLEWPEPWCS